MQFLIVLLGVGWIPVWIGLWIYFKRKDKKDLDEAISGGFKILMKNPEYVRKILGMKDPKDTKK